MSDNEEVQKIQQTIDDILGTKSGLSQKRPTIKDRKRELFHIIATGLAHANARSVGLKHDFKVDFLEYDTIFFDIIEALLNLHFTKEQKALIEWWLYDKFLPSGDMLILNDEETGEEIPTDTPDDLWELIQKYEKENNK